MVKVFEIYIKTTPERLWKALTDTEMRRKYTFGWVVASDWTPGSRYEGTGLGTPILEGENLEVDAPRRLVQSFRALWDEDVKSEGTSRVTYEIEPIGDSCRLTVTHDQLREGARIQLFGGWPQVLSGLKTLLEDGRNAHDARDGAGVIGVVLTGLLDDGTAGLIAIKKCGGVTIVQDPRDAAYAAMPASALENADVDFCVSLAEMDRC